MNHNDPHEEIRAMAEGFRTGSEEAFQWLYKYFSRNVYRFCLRMVGNEQSAKDAYQETFLRCIEHRAEFRGENFPAWLFTIARRVCLNAIRARRQFDEFDEVEHGVIEINEQDVYMQMHIQKALDSLPVVFKEALILREYDGLSYQEIADVLKIDLSLAKVRVHRARLIIRKILTPIIQERYEPR
ncbi:MAG: RNA polymerase sigma factor [Candidatus Kapabacteria bacterium]|nr:RNA polymerase sigma factor [Candidatus Kapabacteria bacterium]